MRKCYILGAGFSKPFGLPLARELTKQIFEHTYPADFWQPSVRSDYLDFMRKLYPTKDCSNDWPDFEDLLTTLDEWEQYRSVIDSGNAPQQHRSASHLKSRLLVHLGQLLCDLTDRVTSGHWNILDEFVASVVSANDYIVSFNWDLLLEMACERLQLEVSYGGTTAGGLQIAKPHGSINIAITDVSELPSLHNVSNVHSIYEDHREGNQVFLRPARASDVRNRVWNPFLEKAVVESTLRKSYDSSWISLQWQRALGFVRQADELVVIGYSLPETDIRPRLLLQLAGWEARRSPQLTIVDPHAEEVKRRYLNHVRYSITEENDSWIDWFNAATR